MSFAYDEFDIGGLALFDNEDFLLTFSNTSVGGESWTVQNPARLRIMNYSGKVLLCKTLTSGDGFWLRPGDAILITLDPSERGFNLSPQYDIGSATNKLYVTFYSNRDTIAFIEDPTGYNSQSGPFVFCSSSGNKANAVASGTINAAVDKRSYITGFEVTGSGATAALPVIVTVTGISGGTMSYIYSAAAGVLVENTPLIVEFTEPIPSSANNTAIVVSCPALGAGNTNNAVVVHGYHAV
jgi:hypothetical protein